MEIYFINSSNPVILEGAPVVVDVFTDQKVAQETVERLNALEEETCRKTWGDGWRVFATEYELETHPVAKDAESVINELFPEGS